MNRILLLLNLATCEILNIERNEIRQEKVLQDPNQSASKELATANMESVCCAVSSAAWSAMWLRGVPKARM